jgi:hypothetical protein
MNNTLVRWGVPMGSMLVIGPVAAWLTSMMTAPDGLPGTPALLSGSPAMGLVLVLAAIALATGAGMVASRLMGAGWGLFCAGMVLAWAAWPTGTVETILRRTQSGGSLWTLAVEGLIVGAAATGAAWLIVRAHPVPAGAIAAVGTRPGSRPSEPGMDVFATGVAAMVLGAGVGVWIAAQEALKGQAIGAAFIGGLVGGMAARLSAERCPTWVLCAGVGLLAAASPALAALIHGGKAVTAAYSGSLLHLANVLPLDWVAGGFMGLPIGVSWAGGMIEERAGQLANA